MKKTLKLWLQSAVLVVGIAMAGFGHAATEVITYYHNDISGSPLLATDAAGAVMWKESYRPYGEKLNSTAASTTNRVGFAGKPFDDNTGLSYMGARYYDPVLGRFTGIDPKEVTPSDLHSFNRYAYANNNPYKFVDPDGRAAFAIIPYVAAWIVGGATVSGGVNAAFQYEQTRQIRWGGLGGVVDAAGDGAILGSVFAGVAARSVTGGVAAAEVKLTTEQVSNIGRFEKKLPANAKESLSVKPLPNEGVAVQATSPGRVPGSSAVYEKQIDAAGKTVQYTKTTYDPAGNIVHVKDKLNGGVFP